jgi:putative restriction endonuclease
MWTLEQERVFRESLFNKVIELADAHDGMLSRQELSEFVYQEEVVRLIDPQGGIWNPGASWTASPALSATLSINTTLSGIYDDQEVADGLWRYDYQSGGVEGKNTKLRKAWELQLPIIWFRQQELGRRYVPYLVYVVDDFPELGYCLISPDLSLSLAIKTGDEIQKRYALREMKQRLHQPAFRARVLSAYGVRCAVCNLQMGALLEGAHITPDSDPNSSTKVNNGISLCTIHHSAYDAALLGIDTDFSIHIRADVMQESDGPMLKYGLQEMHRKDLILPSQQDHWPDLSRLSHRFHEFEEKERKVAK